MRDATVWGTATVVGTLLAASLVYGSPGGSVLGTVRVEGPRPVRPALPVYKHEEICGKSIADERLVLGPNGGVRYAVVTVEGVPGAPRPTSDVGIELDNRECRFVPHVQTAAVGQRLELHNSDPILHNADARLGQETLFNVALPPNRRISKLLDRAGIVQITCDVRHTWMKAYIVVVEHPFHAVTDVYGDFEIRDLPPGSYVLRAWHEELGRVERPITVGEGQAVQQDITFPAPAPAKVPE